MSPETGSLLLLLLFCAGAAAVNHLTTADPTEDKEDLGVLFPREKPGKCPVDVILPDEGSTLEKKCKRDGDCKWKKKCCFWGGRRRCMLPLDGVLFPREKPGTCPADVNLLVDGSTLEKKCKRDGDCKGKDKCCFMKHRRWCMPPLYDDGSLEV
ncbi:whey acidic protein-like [Lithobates pipiens]